MIQFMIFQALLFGSSTVNSTAGNSDNIFSFTPYIIAAIPAIAALIVGLINHHAIKEQNREAKKQNQAHNVLMLKQISASTITDKRTNWIDNLRDALSEYDSRVVICSSDLDLLYQRGIVPKNDDWNSRLEKINYWSDKIFLFLNFNGDIEKLMVNNISIINKALADMVSNLNDPQEAVKIPDWHKNVTGHSRNLMSSGRILLKLEWNRVRKETELKEYLSTEYETDKVDLLESFKKPSEFTNLYSVDDLLNLLKDKH